MLLSIAVHIALSIALLYSLRQLHLSSSAWLFLRQEDHQGWGHSLALEY